ncbi:MAG: VCBS repeat-containing protein [Opitutaceae bacterium]|nr:VCBS repeat-containing protein [Opitutaceae bacterium]
MKGIVRQVLFAAAAAIATALAPAAVEVISTGGRNVYRLAVARAGAEPLIVGTTWDNRLCAFTAAGRHRWDAALGGFAFDVCAADLDGDGIDEILTAGADGVVGCFSIDGKERWKYALLAPVQQVSVARLDGKSPVVLAGGMSREILVLSASGQVMRTVKTEGALGGVAIRMLRAGDFDGDGRDEVGLVGLRGRALDLRFLKGAELQPLPATFPLDGLKTANGVAVDVDGDGAAELLVGRAAISLKGQVNKAPAAPKGQVNGGFKGGGFKGQAKNSARKGSARKGQVDNDPPVTPKRQVKQEFKGQVDNDARGPVHLPDAPKARSYDYHYRMRSLAAGNLTADPGREIAILDGPDIQLCAPNGKVLGAVHAPVSFSDVVCLPGSPHDSIILGSALGGDDNLYRVSFDGDWKKQLASLPRLGLRKSVGGNLDLVAEQAAQWQGAPMIGADGPVDVVVSHHMWAGQTTLRSVDAWIEEVRFFEKNFPYPRRLRFSTCVWPGEKLPLKRPDGAVWPHDQRLSHDLDRDQLVAIARKFEQARCPFWIQVGHGCAPHLSVASATAMLEAAPAMCLGFVSAEDEQAGEMMYYFEHQVRPLLELCLARGKRFIPRNKNVWWCHWPADAGTRRLIFNGRYRSVLLPCVEDSNSRTADAHLAARVGLWLDGQVDDWACRISADWFSFNRAWEWEAVKTGHPHLRYLTSQMFLGARVFMLLAGDRGRGSEGWTRVGTEGVAPFIHLIGRGAIAPPKREQMRAIAPLVVNLQQPTGRFARHGANGHGFQLWDVDGTDRQAWAFDRLDCYWGMAPLPPTDASTWLWGRTRRAADHLPITTPHGFVCILPGPAPAPEGPWTTVWTTDGDRLEKDGKRYSLETARTAMEADLETGRAKLPFRVDGRVFWQVVAQPENRYVICVMDPGWVDPGERTAMLHANLPGTWTASDRLKGKPLGLIGPGLALTVPAGVFKIIDVSESKP